VCGPVVSKGAIEGRLVEALQGHPRLVPHDPVGAVVPHPSVVEQEHGQTTARPRVIDDHAGTRPAHVPHTPSAGLGTCTTSMWNKSEHRMFRFITFNSRGRPLTSYRTIVELAALPITPDDFHREWNCTVTPDWASARRQATRK